MDVYTDGACSGNPGPGGWGWVTPDGLEGSGGELQSTNQRMELQAVLEALRVLDGEVTVYSDSTYVVNCFNDRWYEGWKKRGWRNANKKPVANRDIWEPLIELYLERADEIDFVWVKGHSGNTYNDRADELAVAGSAIYKEEVASAAAKAVDDVVAPWSVERAVWFVGATEIDDDDRVAIESAIATLDPETDVVLSGLRRGTELVAAEVALSKGIPLAVMLPFEDPAAGWPDSDRERFHAAASAASSTVTLPGDASKPGKAIEQRNLWAARQVIGAIVVGEPALAETLDEAGVTVINQTSA